MAKVVCGAQGTASRKLRSGEGPLTFTFEANNVEKNEEKKNGNSKIAS